MSEQVNERLKMFQSLIGKEMGEDIAHFSGWLKGVIREAQEGEFAVEYTVRTDMTNPTGVLHGGVHASIIDDVIGMTVYALNSHSPFTSINLIVDFIGRARTGEKVLARARITREGRQIVNAICEITNEQGQIISRGTSNLVRLSRK